MSTELGLFFAIVAAAGSLVAVIKFWMDMGTARATAATAAQAAAMVAARVEMLSSNLADHKEKVASTYATRTELSEAERAIATGFNNSIQGIYDRLDKLAARLDSLIDIGKHRE